MLVSDFLFNVGNIDGDIAAHLTNSCKCANPLTDSQYSLIGKKLFNELKILIPEVQPKYPDRPSALLDYLIYIDDHTEEIRELIKLRHL